MKNTYIIYCDESVAKGKHFSNFYGGALVKENDFDFIADKLNEKKLELGLKHEVKWTRVSSQYLEKYMEFVKCYFSFIKNGKIKIRIMFRKTKYEARNLSEYHELNGFYLLYYQFIKHAFGFKYSGIEGMKLKTYFDKLPNTKEQNNLFKDYIYKLQYHEDFKRYGIKIFKEDITDVDSKKHVILQGMDIILGAIQFKLNKENQIKNKDTGRRGKRTIAKEKLYNEINRNIREIYPKFNIGITTGIGGNKKNHWEHSYRHWSFIPKSYDGDVYHF